MIIKSIRRGGGSGVSTPLPTKVEEEKPILPEVEVEEVEEIKIEDPDDGEGEG